VKYLMLGRSERKALMDQLAAMPDFVAERLSSLSGDEAVRTGPDETLSPVEQCWHLADLEREGFGARIRRLLEEEGPFLPDFDGGRIARERQYRTRSLQEGLSAFRSERAANLGLLRNLEPDQWSRAGTQEGVGKVALCDLPHMMAEHDAAHRAEIEAWRQARDGNVRGD
jgi:DinB family protein